MTRSFLFTVLLAVIATSCGSSSPTAPPPFSLDTEFTLAPDEGAMARDESVRVRFIEVSEDSRCPTNAQCVWAGEVKVRIGLQHGSDKEEVRELRETDAATVGGRRIELVRVLPYPGVQGAIDKKDYRATFKVSAAR
jgi:hypothetical protein